MGNGNINHFDLADPYPGTFTRQPCCSQEKQANGRACPPGIGETEATDGKSGNVAFLKKLRKPVKYIDCFHRRLFRLIRIFLFAD